MKQDRPTRALGSLLKLRHLAVADAKAALVAALAAEDAAAAAEAAATNAIREEIEAASADDRGDAAVETLAAWLPQARQGQRGAQKAHQAAEAAAATARAALGAARAAEAAVEGLIELAAARQRADTARRALADLNEHIQSATVRSGG